MKIFFGIVALVFLFATQGAFAEGWMCSSDENCPDKEICQDYRHARRHQLMVGTTHDVCQIDCH